MVVIPAVAIQEVQAQPNNPTASERACPNGFTLSRGVCEQQPASFVPTCPYDDHDFVLEEGGDGNLVCITGYYEFDEVIINEETGEPDCNPPYELNSVGEGRYECRHFVMETREAVPIPDCPNWGTPNLETNTYQMRPGQGNKE